jgi:transcriptional regulator with XRE-family HTH domain
VSQNKLAKAVGVSPATLSRWMSGEYKKLSGHRKLQEKVAAWLSTMLRSKSNSIQSLCPEGATLNGVLINL